MKQLLFVIVSLTLLPHFFNAAWAGELRAGADKVSITMPEEEFPYTVEGEKPFVGMLEQFHPRVQ